MLKIILILSLAASLSPKHLHKERYYQEHFCKEGIMEYGLPDRTRVDCLTKTHAIEVDFAEKWAEAIGQSLFYAHMTNKIPAVVLILETPKDNRHLKRLMVVADKKYIRVWTIDSNLTIKNHNYAHYWNKMFK